MHKVNLGQKLSLFETYWSPKIVGELNGQQIKLVKIKSGFGYKLKIRICPNLQP